MHTYPCSKALVNCTAIGGASYFGRVVIVVVLKTRHIVRLSTSPCKLDTFLIASEDCIFLRRNFGAQPVADSKRGVEKWFIPKV